MVLLIITRSTFTLRQQSEVNLHMNRAGTLFADVIIRTENSIRSNASHVTKPNHEIPLIQIEMAYE